MLNSKFKNKVSLNALFSDLRKFYPIDKEDTYSNWQPNKNEEDDIMNHLNYRKLELIYNDYELLAPAKGGLDLTTFVKVMLEHFPKQDN